MDAKTLRASILQMAIEGKLVPQLDEEPAVEQIGDAPEDVPFEIPEKWKWVSFTHTCKCVDGKRIPLKKADRDKLEKRYRYYGATGVIDYVDDFIFDGKYLLIGEDGANLLSKSKDNAFIVEGQFWVNNHAHIFSEQSAIATLEFLATYINAISLSPYVTGTAQPKLAQKNLMKVCVPLPPLGEQRRIVARLNKLLPLVDKFGKAQEALAVAQKEFPEKLKASLLQEAIQGKLVPQLDEEPAVEQIGEAPEDVPFAIPEKWKWEQLGTVFILKAGKFISAQEISEKGPYLCYGGNGIRGKVHRFNREGRFPLIGRQGALCGNINIASGQFYATEHAVVADSEGKMDVDCAVFFLEQLNLNQYATHTAQPGLSVKKISETPFPLPPISEQRRIVARLNELLPLVKKLAATTVK